MISWNQNYDIILFASMISVTYDIIGLWYHIQYHIQNHIWYHGIKTMISYFCIYDISNLWYHRSLISYMITSMISPMISQSIPTLTQVCKQRISMWVYQLRRRLELGRGEERKAAGWTLEVLDGVRPTLVFLIKLLKLRGKGVHSLGVPTTYP